jgi:hypothetical protein
MERELTDEAQADRDAFDLKYWNSGCTCFISPPCSYCTHPGNPLNQEGDECYKPVETAKPEIDLMKSIRDLIGR